jgi:hypothetical protein
MIRFYRTALTTALLAGLALPAMAQTLPPAATPSAQSDAMAPAAQSDAMAPAAQSDAMAPAAQSDNMAPAAPDHAATDSTAAPKAAKTPAHRHAHVSHKHKTAATKAAAPAAK